MKKFINAVLSILAPFAAIPTGWAIFAGVTDQPAFPMNPYAAGLGALAVIATSIAAGMLIIDIKAYNQGAKNKTEREELNMPTWYAWLIFAGCVLAEITLSLLIVVIPGALAFAVLVFPLMTAAGVFAFAVRFDLEKREAGRVQLRAQSKGATRSTAAQTRSAKSSGRSKPQSGSLVTVACRYAPQCDRTFTKATLLKANNAANAHAGKCGFKPLATALAPTEQKVEKPA